MKTHITGSLTAALLLIAMIPAKIFPQGVGGDILNETPFHAVPDGMTPEEYRDANRRVGVGLLLMSVPFPGALHFYAGEGSAGWKHVGVAAGGLAGIILGVGLIEDKDPISFEKSNFQVVDIIGESGEIKRYEKIPTGIFGPDTTFRLRELRREQDTNAGLVFIIVGAAVIVGDIFHDWYRGLRTIERKRDEVRYKHGKQLDWSMDLSPQIDIFNRAVGARVSLTF